MTADRAYSSSVRAPFRMTSPGREKSGAVSPGSGMLMPSQ